MIGGAVLGSAVLVGVQRLRVPELLQLGRAVQSSALRIDLAPLPSKNIEGARIMVDPVTGPELDPASY